MRNTPQARLREYAFMLSRVPQTPWPEIAADAEQAVAYFEKLEKRVADLEAKIRLIHPDVR